MTLKRRNFLKKAATCGAAVGIFKSVIPLMSQAKTNAIAPALFFDISLAQWSLHKSLFQKKLDNLDFAAKAKNDFGISAVEYVNQFFADKAKDPNYLKEMKRF